MRAAIPDLGGSGRIEVVDARIPSPRPNEVLVRVHAAGMNRADLLHAKGTYGQRAYANSDRPNIGGMEIAGRVAALGSAIDGPTVGDAVIAMCSGAYADYIAVDRNLLIPAPEALTWSERASLPIALLTEYEALVRLAETEPGDRVLVTGGTSSVGLIGVQLARTLDPSLLVATTRSKRAAPLLSDLGAHAVAHAVDDLAAVGDGEGFDVVVDHVGGNMFEAALGLLREGGRIVSVGRLGSRSVALDLVALAGKRARVIGTTWKTQELAEIADTTRRVREQVMGAVEDGRIHPVVSHTITLTEIMDGYDQLKADRSPGKVVVILDQD